MKNVKTYDSGKKKSFFHLIQKDIGHQARKYSGQVKEMPVMEDTGRTPKNREVPSVETEEAVGP